MQNAMRVDPAIFTLVKLSCETQPSMDKYPIYKISWDLGKAIAWPMAMIHTNVGKSEDCCRDRVLNRESLPE